MTGKRFSIPQEAIPGMPELPVPPQPVAETPERGFNPSRRRAFGSVPRLLGAAALEGVPEYHEISPENIMEVGAGSLRADLTPARGKYVVAGLALNEGEFKSIIRSKELKSVEEPVEAKTTDANRGLVNAVRLREKELKSRHELLKGKGIRHTKVLTGLESEGENLLELRKYIASPGYALTNELDIRTRASQAWSTSFLNILHVVGIQRGWTPEEAWSAELTMASRLLTGPQRSRVQYWEELTDLALDYAKKRHALFAQRKSRIITSYKKVDKEMREFYEQNGIEP